MAQFVKVNGLYKVFNVDATNPNKLDTTVIKDEVSAKASLTSILYIIAATEDEAYGYTAGKTYTWGNGVLVGDFSEPKVSFEDAIDGVEGVADASSFANAIVDNELLLTTSLESIQKSVGLNTVLDTTDEFKSEFNDMSLSEAILSVNQKTESPQYIETTYSELVDLRDEHKLQAGKLYRITDYHTTTTADNTMSADHQFDIILTAISDREFLEDAYACKHEVGEQTVLHYTIQTKDINFKRYTAADNTLNYTQYYGWIGDLLINQAATGSVSNPIIYTTTTDPDASDDFVEMESLESAFAGTYNIYVAINDLNLDDYDIKTVSPTVTTEAGDDYFADCDLSFWKLKYSIDNNSTKYTWTSDNGTGVIYYMKDEWENVGYYDFKNIMFNNLKYVDTTKINKTNVALGIDGTYSNPILVTDSAYYYAFSGLDDNGNVIELSVKDGNHCQKNEIMENSNNGNDAHGGTQITYLLPYTVLKNASLILQCKFCFNVTGISSFYRTSQFTGSNIFLGRGGYDGNVFSLSSTIISSTTEGTYVDEGRICYNRLNGRFCIYCTAAYFRFNTSYDNDGASRYNYIFTTQVDRCIFGLYISNLRVLPDTKGYFLYNTFDGSNSGINIFASHFMYNNFKLNVGNLKIYADTTTTHSFAKPVENNTFYQGISGDITCENGNEYSVEWKANLSKTNIVE